jgi:hypothetical protein
MQLLILILEARRDSTKLKKPGMLKEYAIKLQWYVLTHTFNRELFSSMFHKPN